MSSKNSSIAHNISVLGMTLVSSVVLLTTGISAATDGNADTKLAASLVEKADQIRFPNNDFEVEVTISTTRPGSTADVHVYKILSKGKEKTIVQSLAPPTERGQILLMRDHDLWAFMPNVSQPIRLSLAQRLTGEVANGDLAHANFAGDYSAKIVRTDTLENENYYVLELNANNLSVTYNRVIYWIHKPDFRPYKAEFYTLSGRLVKTSYYYDFQRMGGEIRPTRLVMEDALNKNEQSVLEYRNMQRQGLPDKFFNKDYLKKLQ